MKLLPSNRDPQEHLWADPEFTQAYSDSFPDPERFVSEADWLTCAVRDYEVAGVGDRVDAASVLMRRMRALYAQTDAMFADVLHAAFDDPTPWVGPDPTADPAWEHPGGWTPGRVRARRRDIAVRAAERHHCRYRRR